MSLGGWAWAVASEGAGMLRSALPRGQDWHVWGPAEPVRLGQREAGGHGVWAWGPSCWLESFSSGQQGAVVEEAEERRI